MQAKRVDDVITVVGKYNDLYNIEFNLSPQSVNKTTQLGDIYLIDKEGTRTSYYKQTTDMVQPWCRLGAVNNIDGDKKASADLIFTGGWHGYTNTNAGTPTSRTVSVLTSTTLGSSYKIVKDLTVTVINHVQGYNTIKEDGSGREILKEVVKYTFKENKIDITVEATPLEEVTVLRYYFLGFQKAWDIKASMLVYGDRFNYTPLTAYETPVYGGLPADCKTNYIRFQGTDKMVGMYFNHDYSKNLNKPTWFYREYGKAYFQPLAKYSATEGEEVTTIPVGETLTYSGGYEFNSMKSSRKVAVYNGETLLKTDYQPIQLNMLQPNTTFDNIKIKFEDSETTDLTTIESFKTDVYGVSSVYPDVYTKGSSQYITGYYTGKDAVKIDIKVDGVSKGVVALSSTPKPRFKYWTGAITPTTLEVLLYDANMKLLSSGNVTIK